MFDTRDILNEQCFFLQPDGIGMEKLVQNNQATGTN